MFQLLQCLLMIISNFYRIKSKDLKEQFLGTNIDPK